MAGGHKRIRNEAAEDRQGQEPKAKRKRRKSSVEHEPQTPESEILSKATFKMFEGTICSQTLKAIQDMELTNLTHIQAFVIPHALERKDIIGNAKTGSGKTLAFLIPVVQRLKQMNMEPKHGTGAIIVAPTRELVLQIYGVLENLMKYHKLTHGLIMGKQSMNRERKLLREGCNILVATPGRLLDHIRNTKDFSYWRLQCLVIDEADRILDIGFEETMKDIIKCLPSTRQTMLFSATQNSKTSSLAALALKNPEHILLGDDKATVSGLEEYYQVCPIEQRLIYLLRFLTALKYNKKVMVFFNSSKSVKFHHKLFSTYLFDFTVMALHGQLKQNVRTATFHQFSETSSGILFCTDVAARGLDFPGVDWVIQYDPPSDPKEYIHRVGRTARGEGSTGRALLFLVPHELSFLNDLTEANVELKNFNKEKSMDSEKIKTGQDLLESIVEKNEGLRKTAQSGMKGFIRAYNAHKLKKVFNFSKFNLNAIAKSFGFKEMPPIHLDISAKKLRRMRKTLPV